MKIILLSVLVSIFCSMMLASEIQESVEVSTSSSSSPSVSIEEEVDIDLDDPEYVKENLIRSIIAANVQQTKNLIEKYEYLVESFNRDIFIGMIRCFDLVENEESCLEILNLIKPSFKDVSKSKTTPLILAIRENKKSLASDLLDFEEVKATIGEKDEFDRTALMYAVKRGNMFVTRRILLISTDSINNKDFLGKTALHYACEMNSVKKEKSLMSMDIPSVLTGAVDEDVSMKFSIVSMLMANGAKVVVNGPEYKLKIGDNIVKKLLESFNGKVVVEYSRQDLGLKAGLMAASLPLARLLQLDYPIKSAASSLIYIMLANPLFAVINEACYAIQQAIMPGVDMNLNLSFDLGDNIQDFSFNILFVMLMIPVMMKIGENLKQTEGFKF